jgi:hypothetical protein
MDKRRLPPSRLHRVFTFINETRWIGWSLPLIGILVAIGYYWIASHADRPEIHITEAYAGKASSDSADTIWVAKYKNFGTRSATHITVKLGTIDLSAKKSRLLAPPDKLHRLAVGPLFRTGDVEFKFNQKDALGLFVTCLYYSDDSGTPFDPVVNFYKVSPIPMTSTDGRCCELADATPAEEKALSTWFACANL